MRLGAFIALAWLCVAVPARGALLTSDFNQMSYAEALERVKAQPERHVMIYFGMRTGCPPCNYTRNQLGGPALLPLYKASFLVTEVDIRAGGEEAYAAAKKYKVSWAPTLVFLDAKGKVVLKLAKGFDNEKHAILVNEYVSQRLYRRTDLAAYVKANFNAAGDQRVVPETKRALAAKPADDRPRLRDVLAQKHERVLGDELRKIVPATRMEKENQEWMLTLDLAPDGKVAARGIRKDGKSKMSGPGVWYVTKKGKFCLEVKTEGLDETWCRHVFRVGQNYYYAVKDLREQSLAYRFTLEKI